LLRNLLSITCSQFLHFLNPNQVAQQRMTIKYHILLTPTHQIVYWRKLTLKNWLCNRDSLLAHPVILLLEISHVLLQFFVLDIWKINFNVLLFSWILLVAWSVIVNLSFFKLMIWAIFDWTRSFMNGPFVIVVSLATKPECFFLKSNPSTSQLEWSCTTVLCLRAKRNHRNKVMNYNFLFSF
jgi:hypothetical protein